jgi:hypothetical protein
MAKRYEQIEPRHREFIERQHVFFTATAARDGRVNLSPKGLDALRVIDEHTVVYLDRTGSGNETAAHLLASGRMTIMLCAFDGPPTILRLYGTGEVHARGSERYNAFLVEAFGGVEPAGARQIVELRVELVQTSCGYGVPLLGYEGERSALDHWAESKTEAELYDYRATNNAVSLDGLPTGLVGRLA